MIKTAQNILKRMRSYQDAECEIPTSGVGCVIDDLSRAIEKEKIRRTKQQTRLKRSISLRKLESILYRETGCVAPVDVPFLMKTFYTEAGVDIPQRLEDEVEESKKELNCR